jgi:hypothetical protein
MTTWKEFATQSPQLAEFGKARFGLGVAYLGTIRPDGSPRIHPVTPIIGDELYIFMEPTSPKGKDLQRDARYTLHSAVENSGGGGGEFYIRGQARLTSDPSDRKLAIAYATYEIQDRYILFGLSVTHAFMNQYVNGNPVIQRWQSAH